MPAYSFKEQFCQPVEEGSKTHTIRAARRGKTGHAEPGQAVYLYYGMRTKYCRKLGEGTCTKVQRIKVTMMDIVVDGEALGEMQRNRFAWLDGFRPYGSTLDNPKAAWSMMRTFFQKEHGLSWDLVTDFTGVIIHWTLKPKSEWRTN